MDTHKKVILFLVFISIVTVLSYFFSRSYISSKSRDFFLKAEEKVNLDEGNWWYIASTTQKKISDTPAFKSSFNLLEFKLDGYSFFKDNAFMFCSDVEKKFQCDTFFIFSNHPNSFSDEIAKSSLLLKKGDLFIFSYQIKASFSDSFSNITIWAISKNYGIESFGHFDIYSCEFEAIVGNSNLLLPLSEDICNKLNN